MAEEKEEIVLQDQVSHAKLILDNQTDPKYIVDTVLVKPWSFYIEKNKEIPIWSQTTVYQMDRIKINTQRNIVEDPPSKDGAVLTFSARSKTEAVAFHTKICEMLKNGITIPKLLKTPELVNEIKYYMYAHKNDEDFLKRRGVKDMFIELLKKNARNPEETPKTIKLLRDVFMYTSVNPEQELGKKRHTYFRIITVKTQRRKFVSRIYRIYQEDHNKKGYLLIGSLESESRPKAKKVHREMCEGMEKFGESYIKVIEKKQQEKQLSR